MVDEKYKNDICKILGIIVSRLNSVGNVLVYSMDSNKKKREEEDEEAKENEEAVSYTHLTLPTIYSV